MIDSFDYAASPVDQDLSRAIKYQGRRAARAKSEIRRREILQAALRIVTREGVQGVKHRAVAKEAKVPLASTTYYFKDISELISDAFTLFAESSQEKLDRFYSELQKSAAKYDLEELRKDLQLRRRFAEELVEMGTVYLLTQVQHHQVDLLSEQAFLMESIRDKRLRKLALGYKEAWLSGLVNFIRYLGFETYEEDASIIIGTVANLEQEGALQGGQIDENRVRLVWRRLIYMMLDIPTKNYLVECENNPT